MVVRYILFGLLLSYSLLISAKTSDNAAVNISYYQSGIEISNKDTSFWQRELITIDIKISTDEEFSYLSFDQPSSKDFIIENKIIEVLPAKNNDKNYIKALRIYIWPLLAGKQSINLPVVHLMLSGTAIRKFKSEPFNITVKPLPDYVPPGFPVGKINLDSLSYSDSLRAFILKPNELANFTLKTRVTGIHPSMIPDYYNYLKSTKINHLAVSAVRENTIYDNYYSYEKSQDIPIVTYANGLARFNDIRLLYFDPNSGKIKSINYSPARLLTLNIFFQIFLLLLLSGSGYFVLFYMNVLKNNIIIRRDIWKQINASTSPECLSSALRRLNVDFHPFNTAIPTHYNHSLGKWAHLWNDQQLTLAIEGLISLQYSGILGGDFPAIKQAIIARLQYLNNFVFYIKPPKY